MTEPLHPGVTLLLGGARSGKSRHAERLAAASGLARVFVATAEVGDDADMAARVARHVADRGPGWTTLEAPLGLAPAVSAHRDPGNVLVVDCLTVWLAQVMGAGRDVSAATDELVGALRGGAGPVVVVANELGLGIHPPDALTRDYRDHHGRLTQAVAEVADVVRLLVAGIPVPVKGGAAGQ